ncbi:MAG: PQQ-dependent dehydrogenase, methanol/ethanol family [Gammaproteobacteria bacterium]|nr:PQQ-dependent dehydrogenase, methanol/ethanol family [Gammaproteobacteria bacterium]
MRIVAAGLLCAVIAMPAFAETIVDGAAIADEVQGANWLSYGRTYSEQRFSPLSEITADNVSKLGLAWHHDLAEHKSLLATPLVVDGVMYFTGSYSVVIALDLTTRKPLWTYDPNVIEVAGERARIMWDSNRGVAYWKGNVYVATGDGRLIGLNAKTGKEIWSTMTVDPKLAYFINGAPRAFKDKIIIGNGGTEWGALRGYVTAYDAATGKQVWRFYTVPGEPAKGFEDGTQEMIAKTWTGKWWEHGGGGTVWNGLTYDPEFNRIYLGTGNGSPWNRRMRSPDGGDNLFLCSIVALDADTGKYVWHYQTVPGETWDYNSNMDMVLADLTINGKPVKAMLHAPKNGFFYVLDRADGKLISADKLINVTWATHVDMKTGRPVEAKGARYEDGEELLNPSAFGVHNWHAMSFNPMTGLTYIPIIDVAALFTDKGFNPVKWQSPNFQFDPGLDLLRDDMSLKLDASSLMAWDAVAKKKVWEVKLPGVWNPGTLSTAGNLVFQGRADGTLVAYRADTGKELWQFPTGVGLSAPPITFSVEGKQYLAILTGWGGAGVSMAGAITAQHGWAYRVHPRRLLVFGLEGSEILPPSPPPQHAQAIVKSDFKVDALLAEQGSHLFLKNCVTCHGGGAVSGGYAPDLRASPIALFLDGFREVTVAGVRRKAGMPAFRELSDSDLTAIQHYLRRQANKTVEAPAP